MGGLGSCWRVVKRLANRLRSSALEGTYKLVKWRGWTEPSSWGVEMDVRMMAPCGVE